MSDPQENKTIENENLKNQILEKLETVIDPELGIDVVNLGLIYEVKLFENGHCQVNMTFTTMGCPYGEVIINEIKSVLNAIPEIEEVDVKLVWYPAWDPSKMSRYAKIALGYSQ